MLLWLLAAAAAAVVAVGIVVAPQVQPEPSLSAGEDFLDRYGPMGAVGLLYLEESGAPLLVPGDVFVIYLGHRIAPNLLPWLVAWLSVILAVVLGATNLYLVARYWGRRMLSGRLGVLLHVTPERLDQAEAWFARWGPWALIFGRHIPGGRIPITVAAGALRVSYPVFAICVAASTATWAGAFLVIGATVGDGVERWFEAHRALYLILPAIWVLLVIGYVGYRLIATRRAAPPRPPGASGLTARRGSD